MLLYVLILSFLPFELTTLIDKVFCSPNCKPASQNENAREIEDLCFKVDQQLKTNRKILRKYNKIGKIVYYEMYCRANVLTKKFSHTSEKMKQVTFTFIATIMVF